MPSTTPTVSMDAPSTVVMNTGSRLWINSDDMSMNIEANPIAQMPIGKARNVAGAAGGGELFEVEEFIGDGSADRAGGRS